MILKENFFIITGGPGVGKTTLPNELRSRGFRYIPEAARNIIKTQMESDGDALPWKNKEKYSSFMLERSVAAYISASTRGQKDILFLTGEFRIRSLIANWQKLQIPKVSRRLSVTTGTAKKFLFFLPGRISTGRTTKENKPLKKRQRLSG